MVERRRQGLCFNCDDPCVRGHKCARLFYLEVTDFDEADPQVPHEDEPGADLPPLISLHAITGIRTDDTMQLRLTIGSHVLTTLVDTRSTHNFISTEAATRVGLHLEDSRGARVAVANGDHVQCVGLARDIAMLIDK